MRRLLCLTLPLTAACAEMTRENPGLHDDELGGIVGGAPEDGFPAVGALVTADGQAFCTGTLIADRWVVSAAHCFEQGVQGAGFVTASVAGPGAPALPVARAVSHPEFRADAAGELFNDIALVELAQPALAAPMRILPAIDDALRQQPAVLVGYGVTSAQAQDAGRKRRTQLVFSVFEETRMAYFNEQTGSCFGDSGGPALYVLNGEPFLAGVTSFGDAQCTESGYYTRVDAFQAFLQQTMRGAQPPGEPGGDPEVEPFPPAGGDDDRPPVGEDPNDGQDPDDGRDPGDGQDPGGLPPPQDEPPPDQGGDDPGGLPPPEQGDPGGQQGEDWCEAEGYYGDGLCDQDCPQPDPDCNGGQQPPPDQGGQPPPQDPGAGQGGDFCEEQGWYGDGFCDQECPQPDPDCQGGDQGGGDQGVDWCAAEGYYGDGFCDEDCPQPDPDC